MLVSTVSSGEQSETAAGILTTRRNKALHVIGLLSDLPRESEFVETCNPIPDGKLMMALLTVFSQSNNYYIHMAVEKSKCTSIALITTGP